MALRMAMIDQTPPLNLDGMRGLFDKRDINARWLAGTVLTGFVGFILMGGALFSATGGAIRFANTPELARLKLQELSAGTSRKSDKLNPLSYSPVTRQAILVQTRTKAGEQEIIKTKTYIRLSAPLSLVRTKLTTSLPAFSALNFTPKDDGEKSAPRKNTQQPDGEISISAKDFMKAIGPAPLYGDKPLSLADILKMQNTQIATSDGSTGINTEITDLFIAQSVANQDGARPMDVKITAANISAISKDTTDPLKFKAGDDQTITVTPGVSLTDILLRQGIAAKEAQLLSQTLMNRLSAGTWKEGLKVQLFFGAGTDEIARLPEKVRILADKTPLAVAVQSDLGHYVIIDESDEDADEPSQSTITDEAEDETDTRLSLYYALYETGLKNGVPRGVLAEFIRISSFDLDFERKVKQGDSIELFYAEDENSGSKAKEQSDILYTAITLGGNTRRFYRFETADDGTIDYYDEKGKSAKKFLLRKPMDGGVFRSGFGSRRHPILGYTRMHTGVDWAAPRGTPILASGNGVIETAGRQSGYGQYVLIKHVNGYESGYAHMSGFARGTVEGAKVRQGQVIGYVGSTGYSTGPHLHYEVIVNGRFVDPLRIKIPQGRALEGNIMAQFERERERIDTLINKAPASTKSAGL